MCDTWIMLNQNEKFLEEKKSPLIDDENYI